MPRPQIQTETTATRRFQRRIGQPIDVRKGRKSSRVELYKVDQDNGWDDILVRAKEEADDAPRPGHYSDILPEKDPNRRGLVVARLSSREMQGGETVVGQAQDAWQLADVNGLTVAYVALCTNYFSELTFEEHDEIAFALEKAAVGDIDWVAYREPDRVARELFVAMNIYKELESCGTELWIADVGRAIDWERDEDVFTMTLKSALGQQQRNSLVKKMLTPLRRRWLEEGRGWPGVKKFGFRRNERTKFLEVDPEQWPIVKEICYSYGEAALSAKSEKGFATGAALLSKKLAARKIKLSSSKILDIIRDPIYVDGSYTVWAEKGTVEVACEPIPIPDPIPLDIYQRNLELLACQKGPNTKVPLGTFCLNNIKVSHAACREHRNPKTGLQPQLKGRPTNADDPSYYHVYGSPCPRYRLSQSVLEPAVIHELLRLAEDPDLQEAWAAATRAKPAPRTHVLEAAEREQLKQQLINLEAERDRLVAEIVSKTRHGEGRPGPSQQALLEGLEDEIRVVQVELRAAELEAARPVGKTAPAPKTTNPELLRALREILTDEVPEDPWMRVKRMAVITACVSEVIVHDVGPGEIELELIGPLVPMKAIEAGQSGPTPLPVSPLDSAAHLLHHYATNGAPANEREEVNTSQQVEAYNEVSRLFIRRKPATEQQRARWLVRDRITELKQRFRGERTPLWRSPRLGPHAGVAMFHFETPAEVELAMRRLVRYWPAGEPFVERTYTEVRHRLARHGHKLPSRQTIRWAAEARGLTFGGWRNEVLPELSGPARKPCGYWTEERCAEALVRAVNELQPDEHLSWTRYGQMTANRPDLPSMTRLEVVARAAGMTLSQFRDAVLHSATPDETASSEATQLRQLREFGNASTLWNAIDRGRLHGRKIKGRWWTTAAWVAEYRRTLYTQSRGSD